MSKDALFEEKIKALYENPKFGLSGLSAFAEKLKKEKNINLSVKELEKILSNLDSYSLTKAVRKSYPTRKVMVFDVFSQLQADLVHMDVPQGAPAKENDGVKYLLTVIDTFSKYAWAVPLMDKSADSIIKAFEPILKETKPDLLQVDQGSEFYNSKFKTLLKKYKTKMFSTNSDKKASIVERFNRTLKMKMGKLFDATNSFRYVDALDDLLFNYNNTVHRTIKMKPVDAINPKNYEDLLRNYYADWKLNKSVKFKVGDLVRIPIKKSVFSKEAIGNWTIEVFKISKVKKSNPVTYEIEDTMGEPIKGVFYAEELQKVDKSILDQPFRIEKVIKTRTKNGRKESLVKYLGYPDKFNEWIPSDSINTI
jgi:hypothetical protein